MSKDITIRGKRAELLLSTTLLAGLMTLSAGTGYAAAPQIGVPAPPMGWSSWNSFGDGISQTIIDGQADALEQFDQQLAPGTPRYDHVNIDDGYWPAGNGRDGNGVPILDPTLWPGGTLAGAVAHIHADGLLAGAYTDVGKTGCDGDGGSEGYYMPDMQRFAQDGFDYVKVDFCGGQSENLDPEESYAEIAQAVQYAGFSTGHPMYLSICDWGYFAPPGYADSNQGPWSWAPGVNLVAADVWRTSEDITFDVGPNGGATFEDVLQNFHASIHPEAQHTGYYNDPDMMVVGLNGLDADPSNPIQSQAHMSLWSVAGAPLLIGANMTSVLQNPAIEAVLSNRLAIAVDQDSRGLGAIEVAAPAPGLEIWSRLLSGSGQRAVVFLNTTSAPVSISLSAAKLGLAASTLVATDVWSGLTSSHAKGNITAAVPAQGATMLVVAGTDLKATVAPAIASGNASTATLPASVAAGAAPLNQGATPLDITYKNKTANTLFGLLTANGGAGTIVAFPPSGRSAGTVSVIADLNKGVTNTISVRPITGMTAPTVTSVSLVAGPVPAFQPAYQADATANTLTGAAVVQPCSTCSDGHNVGYVGGSGAGSGTLTFNNVVAPKAGSYTILVAYLNGDGVDRQAAVAVNGTAGATVNFPRGKDWNTVLIAPMTVLLQKGANSITFSNSTYYAPNFSALSAPQ